ncbi:hypothetical protein [Roseisolibacter sp. H3M3-2]|uniref:hypothetical protein n=1 Tax=Roseisolibacter sp. H3M3-2 TaxID=3031323 RepID=UPI0023DC661C|nr:hypothetical protein [Roseisolibacter sp. H3M3-2]MDF1504127.1 hypothetical protein [Roseisolibacter sp. H3M3-2]
MRPSPATFAALVSLAVLPHAAAAQAPANAAFATGAAVEATLDAARAERLPTAPIEDRVAEGRAKGASEAQVASAAARAHADLRTTREALLRAGHAGPLDAAAARGAQLIGRGYTAAQLETIAHESRDERALLAALDALADVLARGVAPVVALARVEVRLARRDPEAALVALGALAGARP